MYVLSEEGSLSILPGQYCHGQHHGRGHGHRGYPGSKHPGNIVKLYIVLNITSFKQYKTRDTRFKIYINM